MTKGCMVKKSSKFFTDGNVQEEHMKDEGMGL